MLEIPRMPIGARELVVPAIDTDGTNLFKSEMLETLAFSNVEVLTTAADTVTSDNFSVRFCEVMTISSRLSSEPPGAVCASTQPVGTSVETKVVDANKTRRETL